MNIMKQQAVFILFLLGICHIVLDFPMQFIPYADFQAYLVLDGCPPDKNAWENASDILNCSKDSLKNRYHCMPNRNKTKLLEFCYPRVRVRMSSGFCFVLADNGVITKYNDTNCTDFLNNSCVDMSYPESNEMYKYPGCLKINPSKGCYTSDPACPSVPDYEVDNTSASQTTSASETTTIEAPGSSQVTNFSIQERPAEVENGDTTTTIVIAVIVPIVVIIGILVGIICCYKKKKCCFKKGYSFEKIPLLERNTIGNVEILDSGHSIKLHVQIAKTLLTNGLNSVEWKKDGTILQVDNLKYSGGDQREPSLIIQNVSIEDAGNYQCEITLDEETVYSEAFLIYNGEVEVLNSGSLKLCITGTVLANGPHSVEWKKDGISLQMDNSKYLGGDERESSLVIQRVCVEDAGIYQCLIAGPDKTWNIHLFFIDHPAVEFIGTEVQGSSLFLKCEVTYSSVRLSILWKRDNQIITEDEKFSGVDTACLIIKDHNITDSGLYQCTISNALGWSADCHYQFETAKICLTEASPVLPFISKKFKNIKLKARFDRKNGYIPLERLTVQWQKVLKESENNTVSVIDIDNAKYTLQYTNVDENIKTCDLVIHQATEADSGVYCCVLLDGALGKLESEKLEVFVVEDFYNIDEWKKDDSIYEETEEKFCTKIIDLLDQTDVVTLVGPPGVGKTFTARHTALIKMKENGWDICQIFSMEELFIEDKPQHSVQRLIIFDHPFGKINVNILNLVYFLLHKNIFCQLVGKTKVIMTCRSNIFEEITAFPIDVLKNVIYMTKTYLGKSPGLLKEISEAVNVQSGQTQNDDDSENEYLRRLCNHIGAYFSESQNHVYDFYTLILLARQENLILKKSLLSAQENIFKVLEINIPEETFSEGIKSAIKKSKYLRRKRIGDNTVCFCEQECILDAFICHILKKDPQLFLKCAGNEVICSHVCPFSASDGECWRLPDTEQFQTLSKRLHKYLTSDDMCAMSNVIKVPYWKNDEFINVFMSVLSQDRMEEILYRNKRYPILNGRHHSVESDKSNKTNEKCDSIWNETEMLRFELLFTGQADPCSNGFTVLSTNFVYWTISYGRYEAIDQILRLALKQNSNQTDINRCILLACFRSVDIVKIVLDHLKTEDLTNVRFSKSKALFFDEQATILPLHVAIAKKNLELVNVLVGKKVLVNECDHNNRSALLVAMEKNYTNIAETLLKIEGLNVNTHDIESRYPLHLATMKGNENFVKILLDKKAKVDCVDENDVTPLNTASTFGFKDITEMLLKGGAKLNKFDNNEKSPLINALENGHIDVIGLLMQKLNQKSMDLNHSDVDGRTPLFVAVDKCYLDKCYFDTTKRLVKLGADVNVFDSQERTPLYLAAEHNSLELVKYLIKKGSQSLVNKGDANHKTPLHVAIEKNNLEMVDHLVKYGADVNSCDDNNRSPLHVAIENFQNSEILEYLLDKGARVNIHGNQRIQSPIFLAITMKKTEAFYILARNRADLNKKDDKQKSVLCYAVESNDEGIVKFLLHKKVEVDTADEPNKMTPLHYAADNNLYDIVKRLVNKHANINATDSCGRTPLHIASRNGNFEIVEHLVRNGADVNKADSAGDGPWEYAFEKHRKEIMMYLAKMGAHLRTEKTEPIYTRQNS